jgi:hypothetical protein
LFFSPSKCPGQEVDETYQARYRQQGFSVYYRIWYGTTDRKTFCPLDSASAIEGYKVHQLAGSSSVLAELQDITAQTLAAEAGLAATSACALSSQLLSFSLSALLRHLSFLSSEARASLLAAIASSKPNIIPFFVQNRSSLARYDSLN